MRLASLFDGSGGFPLAGLLNGITPVWASEVEPYPIAVTRSRFPRMKHLGGVADIHGDAVEPVDIVTFGSPCQDLSVAGKREGLEDGARSSLFFEAVRIIREMREATNGEYPKFAVWENVPGAFSSNKGNDFRLVLEALARISEPEVSVPVPEKGKWQRAGEVVGDGWSIAWRTLDAQFWGVPQRRKRIYLVADFGGERAGQIFFERESVRGDTAQSSGAGEGVTDDAPGSVGGSCGVFIGSAGKSAGSIGYSETVSPTLKSVLCGLPSPTVVYPQIARTLEARHDSSPCIDRRQNPICIHDKATHYQGGGGTRDNDGSGNGLGVAEHAPQYTLTAADRHAIAFMAGQGAKAGGIAASESTVLSCQSVRQYKDATDLVLYENHGQDSRVKECGVAPTISQKYGTGGNNTPIVQSPSKPPRKYIVRRLMPVECARLQGFPDEHGIPAPYDGDDVFWEGVRKTQAEITGKTYKKSASIKAWYEKLHTDSAEYRMWGNAIALPCAVYVLGRIAKSYEMKEW